MIKKKNPGIDIFDIILCRYNIKYSTIRLKVVVEDVDTIRLTVDVGDGICRLSTMFLLFVVVAVVLVPGCKERMNCLLLRIIIFDENEDDPLLTYFWLLFANIPKPFV
jgi:hypothetical protein